MPSSKPFPNSRPNKEKKWVRVSCFWVRSKMRNFIKMRLRTITADYSRLDQKTCLKEMALLCSFFRRFSLFFASGTRQKKHMGLNFSGHLHPYYYKILILFVIFIKKGVQVGVQPGVQVGCNPQPGVQAS